MMQAEWLRLPDADQLRDGAAGVPDVVFDVVVSPYSVPDAVRGVRTSEGRFRIEFRYIDGPEPTAAPKALDEHVRVIEGRHSGRLLAIEVDIDSLGAKSVGIAIKAEELDPSQFESRLSQILSDVAESASDASEKSALESTRIALMQRREALAEQLKSA